MYEPTIHGTVQIPITESIALVALDEFALYGGKYRVTLIDDEDGVLWEERLPVEDASTAVIEALNLLMTEAVEGDSVLHPYMDSIGSARIHYLLFKT